MTVVVLLGAPGAGKGTQAEILAGRLGIPHVATGDLFRSAVRDDTPIGREAKVYLERGQLVPDAVTTRMLLERLDRPDATNGALLDGFPRTRAQAEALDAELSVRGSRVGHALYIDVPADVIVQRLAGRWICRDGGHVYNLASKPPRLAGRCDIDGSLLVQRVDDGIETVRARLAQQLGALEDVLAYYRGTGVLTTVDGSRSIAEVTAALLGELGLPTASRA